MALTLQTYNPQENGIFPVSATIISGETEAILVDAQFSIKDAEKLVSDLQKGQKKLTTIVITAGDPDFYFGLEPIVKAFPDAKILASSEVIHHIQETKDAKLSYWSPILKDGAPSQLHVPEQLTSQTLTVDGESIELHAEDSYAAYLWIPSLKTVLGGVGISSGIHLWTADSQTPEIRSRWNQVLDEIIALAPEKVIPGHYRGEAPAGTSSVEFTKKYLADLEDVLKTAKGSDQVIETLKSKYPNLENVSSLELSAKVLTGEAKW